MSVGSHLAICRRCRWPERRASGAATDDALLAHAREALTDASPSCRPRLSQCLNSCDVGHTVRLEGSGREVVLVGIRTTEELQMVLDSREALLALDAQAPFIRRVYQLWEEGRMAYHRQVDGVTFDQWLAAHRGEVPT